MAPVLVATICYDPAMLWKMLTPDQWSALGTVVSAVIAALNLVVVIILLRYTKGATESSRAQAAVAIKTLRDLNEAKKRENGLELHRIHGRLQDLNEQFLALEWELKSIHFDPTKWKVLPDDWHQIIYAVIEYWPAGVEKTTNLEQELRQIDFRLRCLAMPISNESYQTGREETKKVVSETLPLVREVWEQMMESASKE